MDRGGAEGAARAAGLTAKGPGKGRHRRGVTGLFGGKAADKAAANRVAEDCIYDSERFNSITHLVGAVLALVGVTVMVTIAAMQGEATRVLALTVYGVTLFLLYLFSTLHHSLRGRAKAIFQVLDHHAIYLLIAGTCTPFTLLALKGSTGWWLFGAVWTTPDV